MDTGSYVIIFLVVTLCIITFVLLYFIVERNLILEEANKLFNKNYKTYKTSKVLSTMLKFSGILVTIIFIVMQFFRVNKSWLMRLMANNENMVINSSIDDLIGVFIGIDVATYYINTNVFSFSCGYFC